MSFEELVSHATTDRQRSISLFAMVNKLATLVGSMHWTLLRFDEPILLTADHPVVGVPLLDSSNHGEMGSTPADGWANTLEIRFALSPTAALLATWLPGYESDDPVAGTWDIAINLNVAARAQAATWWFHAPGHMPALPPAISREPVTRFTALAPKLFPGYDSAAARTSPLREAVNAEVERLVEERDDTTMCIARPERP